MKINRVKNERRTIRNYSVVNGLVVVKSWKDTTEALVKSAS